MKFKPDDTAYIAVNLSQHYLQSPVIITEYKIIEPRPSGQWKARDSLGYDKYIDEEILAKTPHEALDKLKEVYMDWCEGQWGVHTQNVIKNFEEGKK